MDEGGKRRNSAMVERQNIFPEGLKARGQRPLLYAPVVAVVPGKLVFLSGILSRSSKGEIVGRGDMRAQISQVFSNITTARSLPLARPGLTW
jgi:enamine deaminase RidA (YjgF/YER057c/UK114 family)